LLSCLSWLHTLSRQHWGSKVLCVQWDLHYGNLGSHSVFKMESNKFLIALQIFWISSRRQPITVATRSNAWIVFARSNTGDRGFESHSRHGCLNLFCVCVGSDLATGW
jgi:hypothetical protein